MTRHFAHFHAPMVAADGYIDLDPASFATPGQHHTQFAAGPGPLLQIAAGGALQNRPAIGVYSREMPLDITGDGTLLLWAAHADDQDIGDNAGFALGITDRPDDLSAAGVVAYAGPVRASGGERLRHDLGGGANAAGDGVIGGLLLVRFAAGLVAAAAAFDLAADGTTKAGGGLSNHADVVGPAAGLKLILVALRSGTTSETKTITVARLAYRFLPDPT